MRRLLIRPGAIGDFIVSLPAMEFLRAGYTELWTASQNLPLGRFADAAKSIASIGLDRLGIVAAEDVVERLRSFDSIVSWYGANRPEFRDLVAAYGLPFKFHRAIPPDGAGVHAVDYYLAQVGAQPCLMPGAMPRIDCRSGNSAQREDFAIVHPFAASPRKRWPLARFQQLADRLGGRMSVQWCCGPDDNLPGAVRISDLHELGCWIARARVFVGNDSGISHLAAAVGTPVVALFGPTDPRIWAPRGPHVQIVAGPDLESIALTQVEVAVGRALDALG